MVGTTSTSSHIRHFVFPLPVQALDVSSAAQTLPLPFRPPIRLTPRVLPDIAPALPGCTALHFFSDDPVDEVARQTRCFTCTAFSEKIVL
jgi:hypothetical protein